MVPVYVRTPGRYLVVRTPGMVPGCGRVPEIVFIPEQEWYDTALYLVVAEHRTRYLFLGEHRKWYLNVAEHKEWYDTGHGT